MASMLDLLNGVAAAQTHWTPPTPPSLSGIDEIELDFETTGVKWWRGDLPIGVGVARPGLVTDYLPWGHRGGGNLPEANVAEWLRREVRGKKITNLNTRFEIHMAREWGKKWGIDLEAQGNTFSDISQHVALLDDSRSPSRMSQASIVEDYLPDEQKVTVVNGIVLNPRDMASYHAGIVAVRAEGDVRQVQKLKLLLRPMLAEQDLLRVYDLENRLIPVTAEMEKNGTKIDLVLLHRWLKQVRREIQEGLIEVARLIGRKAQANLFEGGKLEKPFNPDSPKDMELLFTQLNIPIARTESGRPSFTAYVMRSIQSPVVQKVFRVGKLIDVESKLVRYEASVDQNTGILRYALHQLVAQKDPWDEYSGAGTISGRYSSTKIYTGRNGEEDEGLNIQQVWKPPQQRKAFGLDEDDDSQDNDIFIIRQLHIPEVGEHLSADAMQIEYRLFAEDTKSERLLKVYEENPLASYHKMIHAQILRFKSDLSYRRCKDLNFAKQYGAGLRKMALMLGFITEEQYRYLNGAENWYNSPLLAETKEINRVYDLAVPEVKPLLAAAMHLAMPKCNDRCNPLDRLHITLGEHRGFIRTLLGRRTRFESGQRIHKALNGRIQGGGADWMKWKLVELHEERAETGFILRWPLHDEVDGDSPDRECAMKVNRILNRQSFPVETRVPILWEVGVGPNWKQLEDLPVAYRGQLYWEDEDGNLHIDVDEAA